MEKYKVLKEIFGYDNFRGIQEESINSILKGNDTICVMATGGGKSITFQIPGLIFDGLTLVISPLISLMMDQVKTLKNKNINAETINSNVDEQETRNIIDKLVKGQLKFLYLSPEKLENESFIKILYNLKIDQIVLDEAHCLSMWGTDFRPSYLKIKDFIKKLNNRPVISCFTATANYKVLEDIKLGLGLEYVAIFKSSFDRPNLFYKTLHIKDKKEYVLKYINNNIDLTGIIYTLTRKKAEELFQLLLDNNIKVSLYHGGLDEEIKKKYQEEFLSGKTNVMCATNSFGMGIDKANIRYVINYDLPESIEDLSQQQGRASRDGRPGECILLYHESDLYVNEYFINSIEFNETLTSEEKRKIKKIKREKLKDVIGYATTNRCLHEYLVSYFGELYFSYCDNCSNCIDNYSYIDVYSTARKIISFVDNVNGRYGTNVIASVLTGNISEYIISQNLKHSKYFGKVNKSLDFVKEVLVNLISDGFLTKTKTEYPTIKTNNQTNSFFKKEEYKIKIFNEDNFLSRILRPHNLKDKLLDFRDKKAKREGIPAYMVLTELSIDEIVKNKPKTKDELYNINGIGEKKVIKYGNEILNIIKKD